jgi:hypothetical protein
VGCRLDGDLPGDAAVRDAVRLGHLGQREPVRHQHVRVQVPADQPFEQLGGAPAAGHPRAEHREVAVDQRLADVDVQAAALAHHRDPAPPPGAVDRGRASRRDAGAVDRGLAPMPAGQVADGRDGRVVGGQRLVAGAGLQREVAALGARVDADDARRAQSTP